MDLQFNKSISSKIIDKYLYSFSVLFSVLGCHCSKWFFKQLMNYTLLVVNKNE